MHPVEPGPLPFRIGFGKVAAIRLPVSALAESDDVPSGVLLAEGDDADEHSKGGEFHGFTLDVASCRAIATDSIAARVC